jgi:site-specific recombinase XerD
MILEKYRGKAKDGLAIPVFDIVNYNILLKKVAQLCGIEKNVSSHTGRHSYATSVCLANGVSIENVAKMLGHSDTKMTRHYAKVLDKSIMRDMEQVNGKFSIG